MTTDQPLTVSNSEMATWQGCRRRWMLRYYHWLSPDPDRDVAVGVMWLGQRLHTALEYWYGYGADPRGVLSVVYHDAGERWPNTNPAALEKEHQLAVKMIEGYLEWCEQTGADEGFEIVSTERDVQVDGPHGVKLRARLDMRVRREHDGTTMFLDHKTVGDFAQATATLEIDGQMRFYSLLDRLEAQAEGAGRRTDGGLYNMLKRSQRTARATPPFYHRVEVRYNDETLRSTYYKVHAVVGEIVGARRRLDSGEDHRVVAFPSPGRDCGFRCEYALTCPLMDDGSAWEELARHTYARCDPYGYYLPSTLPELLAMRSMTDGTEGSDG